MEVTPRDLLVRAYELLGEYQIVRGSFAVTPEGNSISGLDDRGVGFCSIGAVQRASLDLNVPTWIANGVYSQALLKLEDTVGVGISYWNDVVATDDEIMQAFQVAAGLPEQPLYVPEEFITDQELITV